MKTNKRIVAALLGLTAMGAGSLASASTWTFNNTSSNTQGSVTATASAWGNTANGTAGSNTVLQSGFLTFNSASGLGVKNNDCGSVPCTGTGDTNEGINPEHAVDNDQRKDSILFSFAGDKVNLTSTYFGWVSSDTGYGDSDFSVYAYTGAGVGSVNGLTYTDAAMQAAGWALVGHYQGGASTGTKAISSSIYSSYWLIGALNGTNDTKKDAFKLLKVTGGTCTDNPTGQGCNGGGGGGQVPEPGTLLLVGIGLLGLTRATGRRTTR